MSNARKIPIRYQYILFALLPVGIFVVSGVLAYTFYGKLHETRESIYDEIAKVRWEESQLSLLQEFERQGQRIISSQYSIDSLALNKGDEIQLVSLLEDIAEEEELSIRVEARREDETFLQQSQVLIEDEEEYKLPEYKGYTPFDVKIHLEGQSDNILSFLYRLENATTYLFVFSFDMEYGLAEKGEPSRGSGLLQIDQEGNTVEEKEEKEYKTQAVIGIRAFTHTSEDK